MRLEQALRPFDRTYADVTRRIREFSLDLMPPDSAWLDRLVDAFAEEREEWGLRPELAPYTTLLTRFRPKILRLVAGAYLHISYDLPRAMADEWPGGPKWPNPTERRGQQIYFQLSETFPDALLEAVRDFRTVGFATILRRPTTRDVLAPAAFWVDHQRQGAWLIGQFLATSPNRHAAEAKMAEAMTRALSDASLWHPWSIARLSSPTWLLRSDGWSGWMALAMLLNEVASSLIVALPTALGAWKLARELFRLESLGSFVHTWGMLTTDYVAYAARDPEGFDAYRIRRREELGILPRGAAASG